MTCDNASNNDRMLEVMGINLLDFHSDLQRVRCFAHVVNLVAKSLIKQFDTTGKGRNAEDSEEVDKDIAALAEMAEGLAEEDAEAVRLRREAETELDPEEVELEDAELELEAEAVSLTEAEQEEFDKVLRPVQKVFVKVRVTPRRNGNKSFTYRVTRSVS